jgi:hypothetical protein
MSADACPVIRLVHPVRSSVKLTALVFGNV